MDDRIGDCQLIRSTKQKGREVPKIMGMNETDVRLGRAAKMDEAAKPYVEALKEHKAGQVQLEESEKGQARAIKRLMHRAADLLGVGVLVTIVDDGQALNFRVTAARSKKAKAATAQAA